MVVARFVAAGDGYAARVIIYPATGAEIVNKGVTWSFGFEDRHLPFT